MDLHGCRIAVGLDNNSKEELHFKVFLSPVLTKTSESHSDVVVKVLDHKLGDPEF